MAIAEFSGIIVFYRIFVQPKILVFEVRNIHKRGNDGKNRPSGQFFPSSPRYAGDEKPSLLSHDVLPSPALLDFLREQALSKTPQSGGSLVDILQKKRTN
ncbi:hypothetical protein ABF173_002441 [Flavobacterium psychrophilum]